MEQALCKLHRAVVPGNKTCADCVAL